MTRIVLNPPQMRGVAAVLAATAAEFETSAARLGAAPRPELPAGMDADVESTLRGVTSRIRQSSRELVHEARMLRVRAALAELGAAIAYVLSDPGARRLDRESLLKRLSENPRFEAALAALAAAEGSDELFQAGARWQRLLQFREARGVWNELVAPALRQYGQGHYRTLARYFSWQEIVSHWMPIAVARQGISVSAGSLAELRLTEEAAEAGRGVRGLRTAGKLAAPLDIALSGYTVIHGSQYDGTRGGIDRGVAGASVLASSVIVAGAVAPIPVAGQVAAGAILTGAGIWTMGNLAYDHRKDIARVAVSGAQWVDRNKWEIAANVGGPVTSTIYDHRHEIADGAEWAGGKALEGGSWVVHHAPDVGKTLSKTAPWNW